MYGMPEVLTPERSHTLAEVYGVTREVPRTYVLRNAVDKRFVEDMLRDKHIIVHGSSKQGKTCLRRVHLSDNAHIRVQCTRELTKSKLYEMLLKQAGVKVKTTITTTSASGGSFGATGEAKGKIPLVASAKAEVNVERVYGSEMKTETLDFDIDLADPNDIARVLDAIHFI